MTLFTCHLSLLYIRLIPPQSATHCLSPVNRHDLDTDPYTSIMSYLSDPGIGCSERHSNCKDALACSGPSGSSRRSLGSSSNLSLSSITKNPLGWVEDSFNAYRDGLSKEERKERVDRENRKQVVYLKMRNVRL